MTVRVATLSARVVLTAAILTLVILLGQIPWGESRDEAVLRLALRTVRGKLDICRELTPEELEARPVHMRGSGETCDSVPVTYRLRVAIGETQMLDERVEARGARRDRPHNVDRELVVRPGTAALSVHFSPEIPASPTPEIEEAMAELRSFVLERNVRFTADRITLVYLDDSTGTLTVEGG